MKAVHGGQDVDERTARAALQMESARGEIVPRPKLSGEKEESERGGQREPREMALFAERDAGDGLDRGERGFR